MKKAKKSGKRAPKKQAARRKMKADAAGKWFEKLVILQAKLRAPDGCPWDREQTHMTLRTYLIEEAYEVLEALESGDDVKFAEELGDLLLQVVFHAEIARDQGRFDVAGVLDGVSHALPGTMEGFQLTRRASRIGFDWDCADGVLEKLAEETGELKKEIAGADAARIEEETGDLLFAAVNLARFLHVDPEIALKKANAKFAARFRDMERMAREGGKELADVPRATMESLWEQSKKTESRQSTGAAR